MPWCSEDTDTIWRFPEGRIKYSSEKQTKETISQSVQLYIYVFLEGLAFEAV